MKIKRKKSFAAEVSTASLNDIMFFLLLFFLIASTVANPNVIKVLLPKADAVEALTKQQLVLTVTGDKKYYLGQEEIPYARLENAIRLEALKASDPTLVLRMAKDLDIQDLVDVMRIGVKLKVKIVLSTQKG